MHRVENRKLTKLVVQESIENSILVCDENRISISLRNMRIRHYKTKDRF